MFNIQYPISKIEFLQVNRQWKLVKISLRFLGKIRLPIPRLVQDRNLHSLLLVEELKVIKERNMEGRKLSAGKTEGNVVKAGSFRESFCQVGQSW